MTTWTIWRPGTFSAAPRQGLAREEEERAPLHRLRDTGESPVRTPSPAFQTQSKTRP